MNAALGARLAFLGVFGTGFICPFAGEKAILSNLDVQVA
jgi:hypothetical protein